MGLWISPKCLRIVGGSRVPILYPKNQKRGTGRTVFVCDCVCLCVRARKCLRLFVFVVYLCFFFVCVCVCVFVSAWCVCPRVRACVCVPVQLHHRTKDVSGCSAGSRGVLPDRFFLLLFAVLAVLCVCVCVCDDSFIVLNCLMRCLETNAQWPAALLCYVSSTLGFWVGGSLVSLTKCVCLCVCLHSPSFPLARVCVFMDAFLFMYVCLQAPSRYLIWILVPYSLGTHCSSICSWGTLSPFLVICWEL